MIGEKRKADKRTLMKDSNSRAEEDRSFLGPSTEHRPMNETKFSGSV